MSALCQKQTFRPLLDIIDMVSGRVLISWSINREASPSKIPHVGSQRCCSAGRYV